MPDDLPGGNEAAIERWLTRRGIPHFIDRYDARRDILTRAIPFLTLVFLVEAVAAGKLGWPWWANRLAELGALGLLIAVWVLVNRWRGRRPLARPERVGLPEMAVFVLVPAMLQVVFGGEWSDAGLTAAANVAVLAFAYVVTSYGLVPMARWAAGRLLRQIGETLGLVARGLPLLLVAFVFLFVNAEVWQVSATFDGATVAVVLGMFTLVGTLFIAGRLPGELRPLARFADSGELRSLLGGTPAEGLPAVDPAAVPPPTRRQWGNAALVILFTQGLRVVFAASLIGGFFVAFGLVAVRAEVIEAWIQADPDVLGTITVFGRVTPVTAELIKVASFLAGFSGMYLAVYLVTDQSFRAEFFDDVTAEIRQAFAVRAAYLGALRPGRVEDA